jgi:stage IV sporulation protein FB
MQEQSPQTYTRSAAWRTIISLLIYILIYYALFRDIRSILLLVLVILVHEAGHFVAMKKMGYRDLQVFFIPFFGAVVSGQSKIASAFQRAIMILAGPLPGIFIGLVMFALSSYFDLDFLRLPALLFLMLNAINLLPVSPLDGGQFLRILYPSSNRIIQTVFSMIMIIIVTWLAFRMRNYMLLIIDIFLFYKLSILFGERAPADINATDTPQEMSEGKKAFLLLLWLIGLLLPVIALIIFTRNKSSFF